MKYVLLDYTLNMETLFSVSRITSVLSLVIRLVMTFRSGFIIKVVTLHLSVAVTIPHEIVIPGIAFDPEWTDDSCIIQMYRFGSLASTTFVTAFS